MDSQRVGLWVARYPLHGLWVMGPFCTGYRWWAKWDREPLEWSVVCGLNVTGCLLSGLLVAGANSFI